MSTMETACKDEHSPGGEALEDELEEDCPSLGKATIGTKKSDRKWHARASTIPKAVVVRRTLLSEAVRILELVNSQYGIGDAYLDDVFGRRISVDTAHSQLMDYLGTAGVEGCVKVKWSNRLSCTACLASSGCPRRLNKPHKTKFTLMLNSTHENMYLRANGITALGNHEIGTHYFRARNEGFQVWYPCRSRFGLCGSRCYRMLLSEEGLATVNTYLSLKSKLLWKPALVYYAAHMAQRMNTDELYTHLRTYVLDPDIRRKIVLRAKRSHGRHSSCGWDQCYFTGAVKILRQMDNIDFTVMHSGKLAVEDLDRTGRVAKTTVLKLPHFISSADSLLSYTRTLTEIKQVNCL